MRALRLAALAGCVHAAFSLYWGLGGGWLLSTVGEWAVQFVEDQPVRAGAVLIAVSAVKLLGALLPLGWAAGGLRPRRAWRWLFTAGSVVLVGTAASTCWSPGTCSPVS